MQLFQCLYAPIMMKGQIKKEEFCDTVLQDGGIIKEEEEWENADGQYERGD